MREPRTQSGIVTIAFDINMESRSGNVLCSSTVSLHEDP
jgi:hypothetical protein